MSAPYPRGGEMVLQYLAALVLVAHGLGHSVYILASWMSVDSGFSDKPWILPGDYMLDSTVGTVWGVFWVAALALFAAAGTGVLMEKKWWRTCALTGSVVSLVAILPWATTVVPGALAGAALDVAIILVLLLPFGDKVTDFFEVP